MTNKQKIIFLYIYEKYPKEMFKISIIFNKNESIFYLGSIVLIIFRICSTLTMKYLMSIDIDVFSIVTDRCVTENDEERIVIGLIC